MPFRNQSETSTVSGERVSLAFSHELQNVPGFEVLPVGVVESQLSLFEQQYLKRPIATPEDFQNFAQYLGADAVIQGAITDYDAYYPPRMTLKTNWYTANPNFHAVPVGYGLPWGTKQEKQIPEWIRLEAERELASEQMVSQTPADSQTDSVAVLQKSPSLPIKDKQYALASSSSKAPQYEMPVGTSVASDVNRNELAETAPSAPANNPLREHSLLEAPLPITPAEPSAQTAARWPDPEGFIPPLPSSTPPQAIKFTGPVISHMATYNGANEDFTSELEHYYYFRDDGRFGGWEAYLQRSEDFIRFCCYLHIKQTLVGRGGQLKNRTVVRWPISRYER